MLAPIITSDSFLNDNSDDKINFTNKTMARKKLGTMRTLIGTYEMKITRLMHYGFFDRKFFIFQQK